LSAPGSLGITPTGTGRPLSIRGGISMAEQKLGNPAVVGLGGFGLATMVLQFHNVGWMGLGPVIWVGLIFGGLAQMIAGLQEMKSGNNFGYCAFTGFGAFWISLVLLLLGNHFNIYPSSTTDIGWFMIAWTMFTGILWIGSMRISNALALTFTLLMIGFILLDLAHFGYPALTVLAGYELMVTAAGAWYIMAHIVFADVFGRDVLPVGKPWF
jgi:succinate-acetate transporter protein